MQRLEERIKERVEYLIQRIQENPRECMKQIAEKVNPKFDTKYERYFARKVEIEPERIELELELVSDKKGVEIFRNAMSFWSVPISAGYGRRMRFIVWDKVHNKVFGVFGLCDPVIGLKIRDDYIGWNRKQREERLYNVMTAYILGAVPPYNEVYGAKMVALAVGSEEVCRYFEERYKDRKTVIRGRIPIPKLVAVDTMAFFGKSLIYEGLREWQFLWQFLDYTKGQMHIHLWDEIMHLAKDLGVKSFERYKFGDGPNWGFRVLQDVFRALNMKENFLFTGLKKGYYFRPLIKNWREFLKGESDETIYVNGSFEEYFEFWKAKYLKRRIKKFMRGETKVICGTVFSQGQAYLFS
jgi:hypothetical protein